MSASGPSIPIDDDAAEHLVEAYEVAAEPRQEAKLVGERADETLHQAYQRADRDLGSPQADALLAEVERRGRSV